MQIPITLKEELGITDADIENLGKDELKELFELVMKRTALEARDGLIPFVHYMDPYFCEGRHHKLICEHLEGLESRQLKRLMIFMPPRSSKSYLSSIYFPAWYMGRNPRAQVLAVSYNIDLVQQFGRGVRNLINSKEYPQIFPETRISPDWRSSSTWATTEGGIYNGAGIGAGIAGKGASLGIIDDPINEQDAFSVPAIEHVKNWYPQGFRSRLMPNGVVLLTMTRWVLDDLAGYLLKRMDEIEGTERWEILKIPAILDETAARKLGWTPEFGMNADYAPGTSYWPPAENPPEGAELTGWPTEYVKQTKLEMPPERWQALYMQEPVLEGGSIFKDSYIQDWHGVTPPDCKFTILSVDTAYSTKTRGNFSAMTHWGFFYDEQKRSNMILLGAWRGRWEFPELKKRIRDLYEEKAPDVILVEEKTSGAAIIQELRSMGLPMTGYNPGRDDKASRAHACIPMIFDGRLWFPAHKTWANDVRKELLNFQGTGNEVDDYVDTVTQVIIWSRAGALVLTADDMLDDRTPEEIDEDELEARELRKRYY